MNKNMKDQIAIVTGGGSGIGQAVCLDLAQKGVKVMITNRSKKKAEETKRRIEEAGGYAETYIMDVTDTKVVHNVVQEIHKKHGKIDILMSNAGITTMPAFCDDIPEDDWDKLIKVHVYGAYNCIKECAKIMKANKYGRIIITSSLAGVFGLVGQSSYAVSKFGLVGLTYSLAKELGPYGITVNAIQPGIINTPMTAGQLDAFGEKWAKETPVLRNGEPKDVATAVSFFCSPESEFITGVVMRVDGGWILQSSVDMSLHEMCSAQSDFMN